MSEYCVVVAGGSKARILTLEPVEFPELQSGPNLIERKSLEHPTEAKPQPVPRPARNRPAFSATHDKDRKFARDIASELDRIVHRNGYQHVVLCADKRMLGMLRPNLDEAVGQRIQVREVPKDLGKLSCREIHDRLARQGHLPSRRRPRT